MKTYNNQQHDHNVIKLRKYLEQLPVFCNDFFTGIAYSTSIRTQLAYANDLKLFFNYLQTYIPDFSELDFQKADISTLESIKVTDIEKFLNYLTLYQNNGTTVRNDNRALKRKLCAIRSLYNYYHKRQMIKLNPAIQVNMPKITNKNIIKLDNNEVIELLDNVKNTNLPTERAQKYSKNFEVRDFAIVSLLLGTGIRISECVGLDLEDVNLKDNCIAIIRKGGKEDIVYFNNKVKEALENYINERKTIPTVYEKEKALFLSSRRTRMQVRNMEILVKKYTTNMNLAKNITPHKLRSTFATHLYEDTGDIYLVASVLGHEDVNTTKKHYASIGSQKQIVKDIDYRRD